MSSAAEIVKGRIRYRPAQNGANRCARCLRAGWHSLTGDGSLRVARRCEKIGTGAGEQFAIRGDHVCDVFDGRGD